MDEKRNIEERLQELLIKKQYARLKEILAEMNPADIALFMSELKDDELVIAFRITPKDLAADTFVEMDSDRQQELIHNFTDKELTYTTKLSDGTLIDEVTIKAE